MLILIIYILTVIFYIKIYNKENKISKISLFLVCVALFFQIIYSNILENDADAFVQNARNAVKLFEEGL